MVLSVRPSESTWKGDNWDFAEVSRPQNKLLRVLHGNGDEHKLHPIFSSPGF